MEKTYIYALICPLDNTPRYIGKSNNPKERLRAHWNKARFKRTHKFNWISKLKRLEKKPKMIILETVSTDEWKSRELYWIRYFFKKGYKLTNTVTKYSTGLTKANKTSFKKGNISWNTGKKAKCDCVICGCDVPFYCWKRTTCSDKCLLELRKQNKGQFASKFTEKEKEVIIKSQKSLKELAKEYNVSRTTIGRIKGKYK